MEPKKITYESMGTSWTISIWDSVAESQLVELQKEILEKSENFNQKYSRFISDSFVTEISTKTGVIECPPDFVPMLRLYKKFYEASNGKLNPLIGFSISDLGYDANYSLKKREHVRPTWPLDKTIRIVDDTHVSIQEPVLVDFGALGKGYFVDTLKQYLVEQGFNRFLVDGSGDSAYVSQGEPVQVGLEHPDDPTKVIGRIEVVGGAICASGTNRRKWGNGHHIIDPHTLISPDEIIATWVLADTAAVADGLATALFLSEPEKFKRDFKFEYCLLNKDYKIKRSAGFIAELF